MSEPNSAANDISEVNGIALATFSLAMSTIHALKKSKTFTQQDVNDVVGSAMLVLEKSDDVSESSVHTARSLLSTVAQRLGVPTKPSH